MAEDVAAYLDLYRKYRDDYGIDKILAGKVMVVRKSHPWLRSYWQFVAAEKEESIFFRMQPERLPVLQ